MSRKVEIALAQMSMSDDMSGNLAKALEYIREAARRGADIVCLPELFRTPYFCTVEHCTKNYLDELPGSLVPTLSEVCASEKIHLIAGSVYEKADSGNFNTSIVVNSAGELVGYYRKTHIPHDPAFYEQNYFTPSDEGFKVFELSIRGEPVKVAVLICYDQWFPEAARSVALLGADIIFYPTAIATLDGVDQSEGYWHEAWKTVQRGHAIANATVVCAINRVGREGSSKFWGGSFVCNAFGHVLAEGSSKEEVVTATVDLDHNVEVREGWRFFKERRPERYDLLTKGGLIP